MIECRRDLICGAKKPVPFVPPFLVNHKQQFFQPYRPIPGGLRKIGSGKKRFLPLL